MFIAAILIGLVPFLLGLLFELIVVIPLRVPYDQTPLYFPWQVSTVQCYLILLSIAEKVYSTDFVRAGKLQPMA